MQQWVEVIEHCTKQPEYEAAKAKKGYVSMYDINDRFVKPWTAGTGCGVSVLMSEERELAARLMLSHAWGEDAEELLESVKQYVHDRSIAYSTPLWFCVFANYQAQDGYGPSIQEQIKMSPFSVVIESPAVKNENGGSGMLVVHTTRADLYSRLWCVHEVDRAAEQSGVEVGAALSQRYVDAVTRRVSMFIDHGASTSEWMEAAEVAVNTSKAKCGNPD
eukprot:CAMPEP_0179163848 /NCGR_PEP_ID=MMETSP0796-20121207/80365_1 /TAXON_ID=73915 /ORGANISM="Pyrodinium bahamense, Strain pbaha01" /LENGTH=218 /DNA_ID=CAMNT_0020866219 /DNA_START=1 /DNA_END=653 /DNA_ORIENTATION=-